MSFFAGRFSDNKTVLSLLQGNGGDTNLHYNPSQNSIFHSDMPFVLIQDTHTTDLIDVGDGYFSCQMPGAIANYLTNDSNRIIITILEYEQGGVWYKTVLQGTSTFHGQFQTGSERYDINANRGDATVSIAENSGFSRHINLDVGTYNFNPSIGHTESIARSGSGGLMHHECTSTIGGPGPNWLARARLSALAGLGYRQGATTVPIDTSDYYLNPDWSSPLGSAGRGHQWFYVNRTNIKSTVTASALPVHGNNEYNSLFMANTELYAAKASFGSIQRSASRGGKGYWYDWIDYGILPKRVTWYVTNLQYNGNGGFFITDRPFTGSDIKLSPNNFTIKGVDLSTVPWRFINQTLGVNMSRGDMEFSGLNSVITDWNALGSDRGVSGFVGSANGNMIWTGNVGNIAQQLSIYKFGMGSGWWVNTNSNAIGNGFGEVWGPNQIPLKYFDGNSASVYIGDSITPRAVAGGQYYWLATVNLGLINSGTSTVVLTAEHISGAIHKIAGLGNTESGVILQARNKINYDQGDGKFHQILTLPTNGFVPFHIARLYGVSVYGSTSTGYMSLYFVIKNNGNGSADIGVFTQGSRSGVYTFVPNMRVSVQKLT